MKKKQQQRVEAALCYTQNQMSLLQLQASTNLPLTGFNGALRSAGKVFAAGAVLCASLVSLPAVASTLYSQPVSSSWLNFKDSSTSNGWLYDHFVATQSGTVSNITWQGEKQPSGNSGFIITILQGLVGSPGLPELSTVTPLLKNTGSGNAGQTAGNGYYNFTMDLPTSFNLVKDSSYWINIESNGAAWGWASGTGGIPYNPSIPNINIQYCTATYSCIGGDAHRAFSLNGTLVTAVPVPAAVWLFGSGLTGLLSFSRRKKTANF